MTKSKKSKEQQSLGISNSSDKLQEAIVSIIDELKLMYTGVPYDVKIAIEKNVEYLNRVLKESGYNI